MLIRDVAGVCVLSAGPNNAVQRIIGQLYGLSKRSSARGALTASGLGRLPRRPRRQCLLRDGQQHFAAETGAGLDGHAVQHGHQVGRQRRGLGCGGQVALAPREFEPFAQQGFARRAKRDQRVAHRRGVVGAGQRAADAQATGVVGIARVDVDGAAEQVRRHLARRGQRQRGVLSRCQSNGGIWFCRVVDQTARFP